MIDPDSFELKKLWKNLCATMCEHGDSPQALKEKYQCLVRFLGVAVWKKYQYYAIINEAEQNGEEFLKRVKAGTLRGMHYEERRLLERLREPQAVKDARQRLDMIDLMLEGARSFERTLSAYFDAMKLDLKLSFEGHE
ncbi:MAG: hypothetical protein KAU24_01070 [Candidatus Aenigmarchaeota archaeon]|nr:hypothetical protein [Candidatus Aenigmarchaeota archaeon]